MEIFKKIIYNGYYEISNFGNVKSNKKTTEKILKNKTVNGYKYISFKVEGKIKNFYIHRLVAIHFIPNPKNKLQVNHIDGNKSNNHINNLEWCTPRENSQHSYDIGLSKKGDYHYLRIRKYGIKSSNYSN